MEYKEKHGNIFSEVNYTICYICGEKLIQDYAEILSHLQMSHKEYSVKSYFDEFIKEPNTDSWDLSQCIMEQPKENLPKARTIHTQSNDRYPQLDEDTDVNEINQSTLESLSEQLDTTIFHINKETFSGKVKNASFYL